MRKQKLNERICCLQIECKITRSLLQVFKTRPVNALLNERTEQRVPSKMLEAFKYASDVAVEVSHSRLRLLKKAIREHGDVRASAE
jgi:hypothetical protein